MSPYMYISKLEEQQTLGFRTDFATARYDCTRVTPRRIVHQGRALTRLRLPTAIHEGP